MLYFNCLQFMTVCPHCYPLFYGTNHSELKVKLNMMRYQPPPPFHSDMSRSGHCGIVSNPQRPQPHIFPSVGDAHYLCSPHHCSDGLCRDNNTPFNLLNDYNCKKTTTSAATVPALILISGQIFVLVRHKCQQFVVLFTSHIYEQHCYLYRYDPCFTGTPSCSKTPVMNLPTRLMNLYFRAMRPPVFCHGVYSEAVKGGRRGGSICPKVRRTLQHPNVK